MLTKHKMTWKQTLFLKFSTPSERKLQVKYWGSRLEAADGCTSDECTSAEGRLVGLYFSVLVLFFCQKAATIRPDLSKCRETGLKMQRKYLRLFCVTLQQFRKEETITTCFYRAVCKQVH